jgi:putative membrane protein
MKLAIRIGLVAGLGVMIALIVRGGIQPILTLLSQAGWRLLWLVPLQVLPLLLDVLGWRALISGSSSVAVLFLIAAIRQAINRLLPAANIGGEIVGIRLLATHGTGSTVAAASIIVEGLLTFVSQYLFLALGIVCLLQLTGSARLTSGLLVSLGASLPVIALLIGVLRNASLFGRLQHIAERLFGPGVRASGFFDKFAHLDTVIQGLCRAHGRLGVAVGWQLAGLIVGCSETWLALRWLGTPIGIAQAVSLESLTQAARSLVFLVPAGLGVQEASLIGFGHILGIGAEAALALSLAKRMREIVFGVPALLAWQWMEGRRGFERARSRSDY